MGEGNAGDIECGHFRIVFESYPHLWTGIEAGHSTERDASNVGAPSMVSGSRASVLGAQESPWMWFDSEGEISARAEYSAPRATAPFVEVTHSGENEPTSQNARRGVDHIREAIQCFAACGTLGPVVRALCSSSTVRCGLRSLAAD